MGSSPRRSARGSSACAPPRYGRAWRSQDPRSRAEPRSPCRRVLLRLRTEWAWASVDRWRRLRRGYLSRDAPASARWYWASQACGPLSRRRVQQLLADELKRLEALLCATDDDRALGGGDEGGC